MIPRIVGLVSLTALLGGTACLDETGPADFTTRDSCFPGDTLFCYEGCGGEQGLRICDSHGRFGECVCPGCTSFPDCNQCGDDCFNSCMCQTARQSEEDCEETCADFSSDASTN